MNKEADEDPPRDPEFQTPSKEETREKNVKRGMLMRVSKPLKAFSEKAASKPWLY